MLRAFFEAGSVADMDLAKITDLKNIPDRERAVTYLEASPPGLGLYVKHGWRPCDDLVIDLRPYGGDHVAHAPFMVRQASVARVPES